MIVLTVKYALVMTKKKKKKVDILEHFGSCYSFGKKKEKKKNLPNLCPGAPLIDARMCPTGSILLVVTALEAELSR